MRPLCYLRNFAILALLLSSLSVCPAQTPTSPPRPPPSRDPSTLVKAALHRMEQADDAKTLYTRFDLEHTVNHNKKGKLTSQYTALYEDTWINDLPYKRLVEWNGKPLTGADLAAEQARYDKAVADRQKLDLASRAVLMHQKLTNTIIRLNKITTPDYRLVELRQQTLNANSSTSSKPTPSHPSTPPIPSHSNASRYGLPTPTPSRCISSVTSSTTSPQSSAEPPIRPSTS